MATPNGQVRQRRKVSATELSGSEEAARCGDCEEISGRRSSESDRHAEEKIDTNEGPSLQRSLQSLCGLDPSSTADLLAMPGRALDRAEEMARQAWEAVDPISSAELLAFPGRAFDRAEEMARHAWHSVDEMSKAELLAMPGRALDRAEEMARHAWTVTVHHCHLPQWLRDNDCLVKGHRPPLNSYGDCFKSMFRIHTETGNIWTHLVGFVAFIVVAVYVWTRPSVEVQLQEKAVFSAFFAGAILCLGFSWVFHTVYCHSESVGKLFCRLDYCGIAMLIVGSFVPWLYYCFYCKLYPQVIYTVSIVIMGVACVVVSMTDTFAEPQYRPLRAGVYIMLSMSGVIPAAHYIISEGIEHAIRYASFGWLMLMAFLYMCGAALYAFRIPECLWPGKFDIWFSSHQLFHVFVVAAAFVHYHGMSEVARNQILIAKCIDPSSSL